MTKFLKILLILSTLTVLSACTGGGGGGSGTPGPTGPTTNVKGSVDNITLDPISLEQPDFGRITSTETVVQFLNIRNIGEGIISPIILRLTGADASFFTLETPTCPDLQPLSANVCTIRIAFNPLGKLNRIYIANLEINGITFPFSAELAIRSTGVSDYQIYQAGEFIAETIDLGKSSGEIIHQTVLLRHLLKTATGNIPLIMTSPHFILNRTSCPAIEINRSGCPITISFNPEGKAKRVYTAPFTIGNNLSLLNLKAEHVESGGFASFEFLKEENQRITEHDFGAVTVPEKQSIVLKLRNNGTAAGQPTLAIVPNQVFIIGDTDCERSLAVGETCSVKISVISNNRLANKYLSKFIAGNNNIDLKAFIYTPNKCLLGTHLDPDSLACVGDIQTEVIQNGVRNREWIPSPAPGLWGEWSYSCTQPNYELNETADACIFKQRRLTLSVEGNGSIVGGESRLYNFGSVVTLKAVPAPFNMFQEWQGGSCSGSVITCTVTMNQVHNVKAVFYVPPLQIIPNPVNLYVGNSQQLTVDGGIPPYTYSMQEDALGSISPSGLYSGYSIPTEGAIRVRDSQNRVVNVSLKVVPPMTSGTGIYNVVTDVIDNLGVTGGLAPYTFVKNTGVGTGGIGGYSTGSTPGSAFVTVTDGLGSTRNINVNVVRPLQVSPTIIASEVNKNITLSISNGLAPYTSTLEPNSVGTLAANVYRTGNTPGTAVIKVKDAMNNEVLINVVVVPVFEVPESTIYVATNSSKIIPASGGLLPYTFIKNSGPGQVDSATGNFVAFGVTGTAEVSVTDSLGNTKNVSVIIYPPLALDFTSHTMEINKIKTINVSGGIPPYTYSIKSGTGVLNNTNQYTSAVPTVAVIEVKDSINTKVEATVTVVPEFKLAKTSHNMVALETHQIVATGGLTPYTYTLVAGGKGSVNASGLYTAPNEATTDTVEVTDGLGSVKRIDLRVVMPLTASVSSSEIYVNQTSSLTVTDGLPPYTFRLAQGLGVINTAGLYTASSTATQAQIEVTDAMGTKRNVNVTVYNAFAVSPLSKNLLTDQTQQISASGGKAPILYRIVSGPGSVSSSGLFSAGSSPGDTVIEVKDSLSSLVNLNYKIVEPLLLTPPSNIVLINQSVQLTASKGLPPYSFDVSQGVGSVTQAGLYTASSVAQQARVRVTDAMGNTASSNIQVILPLTVPNENIITTVQKIIQILPSGGLTPYTFEMVSGGGSISTTGSFTAPVSPGFSVIRVSDSSSQSKIINIETKEALVITPQNAYLEVNQTRNYAASGGLAPYTFSVLSGRGSINSSTGVYSSGTVAGEAVIRVTDALGNTSEANMQVLDILTLSPTSSAMVINTSKQLTAAGGLPPYTYQVMSGGGSISASGLYSAPSTPSSNVSIKVTDSLNTEALASINVVPELQLGPSGQSVTVNKTIQFNASGGLPPYSYSVISGSITSSGLYTAGSATGNQTIRVRDSIDNEKTVTVNVVPDLTLLIATNINLLVNQSYQILVTGGLEPYNYQITSGNGSVTTLGTYTAPATPSDDVVRITDALGNQKTVSFKSVNMLQVSPTVINMVVQQTRTITPSQGLPPYTYTFSGVGSFNSSTRVYTSPTSSGGSATITVKDAMNNQVPVNITVYTSLQNTLSSTTVQSGSRATFTITGGSGDYTVDFIQNANIGSSVRDGYYYAGYSQSNVSEQIRIVDNITGESKTSSIINVSSMPSTLQKVGAASSASKKGSSVASTNSFLVIGSPEKDSAGAVEIYSRLANEWQNPVEIISPQANSLFGQQVAIENNLLAISAPNFDTNDATNDGKVFIYRHDGSNWVLESEIESPIVQENENFGSKITLFTANSSTYLAVSSNSSVGGANAGSVYLFLNSGSNWNLVRTINGATGDQLGFDLKGSYNHLIIGVPNKDYSSLIDAGEALVLVHNGSSFEDKTIRPSSPANSIKFGSSVAVDKLGRVAIGAPNRNSGSINSAGSVFAYYKQNDNTYAGEKIVSDPFNLTNGKFGKHLQLIEDYLVVSSEKVEGVTVFDYKNDYVYLRTLRASSTEAVAASKFGQSFTASSSGIIVGSPDSGEVYSFNWDLSPNWPIGTNGDLIITSGQTIQLSPGSLRDYRNVRIDSGGVLEITAGGDWVILGVQENLIVNGTIRMNNSTHTGGTFNASAPNRLGVLTGESLSYSITQAAGGSGGNSRVNNRAGGAQNSGNGGGAAGEDGVGGAANASKGGDGGATSGGAGSTTFGNQGANAGSNKGGGGGGFRGKHGQGLYLKVKGNISGSGNILASGQAGTKGGNGTGHDQAYTYQCNARSCCLQTDSKGNCTQTGTCYDTCNGTYNWGGGGGGGGAGGAGGKVSLRYRQQLSGPSVSVSGGPAGGSGTGGNGAANGGTGSAGANGIFDSSSSGF